MLLAALLVLLALAPSLARADAGRVAGPNKDILDAIIGRPARDQIRIGTSAR